MQQATDARRAYQCVRCRDGGVVTVNRKDRLEHHILKQHVSLEETPYYCTLCMFRCQRLEDLYRHVTHYQRHLKIAREMGVIDNARYLVTSSRPKKITEQDMIMLSVEQSERWSKHGRKGSTSVESEGEDFIYTPSLEDASLLATTLGTREPFPLGTAAVQGVQDARVLAQQVTMPPTSRDPSPFRALVAPTLGVSTQQMVPPLAARTSLPQSHPDLQKETPAYQPAPQSATFSAPVYKPTPIPAIRIGRGQQRARTLEAAPEMPRQHQTLDMPTLDSLMWSPGSLSTGPSPGPVAHTSGNKEAATPLLDEPHVTEDLLAELLLPADMEDPLAIETGISGQPATKASIQSAAQPADQPTTRAKSPASSPPSKRAKKEEGQAMLPPSVVAELVAAFKESTAAIVDAIDRNSRAVRCQGAAIDSLVGELREVNRRLRQQERRPTPARPSVRSTVHRPLKKK